MGISILDAQTVGRIAAGEVVERPSSVAKELIENALDAGATAIAIEIRDGGSKYLRVSDNGCGIAPNEARLAFENHATSKIQSGDELTDLRTMGFRGEALASIAAVSKVTMTTRRRSADAGVRLHVEGGSFQAPQEIGCPEGTTIIVEDLFFNLPARRAFLKKSATEAGAVSDLVQRMIMGYPGVAFRYMQNGRSLYHSSGDGNLRHAAFAIYGREVAEKLELIEGMQGGMSVSGVIGTGELSRPSRSYEYFFINGRTIRCALLTRTVEEMLAGRVLTGQYPICALNIRIPPNAVDVNVHPSKLEVRFRDEVMIRQSLESILAEAFRPRNAMIAARQEGMQDSVKVEVHPTEQTFPSAQEAVDIQTEACNFLREQTEVFIQPPMRLRDAVGEPNAEAVDAEVLQAYQRERERLNQLRQQAMSSRECDRNTCQEMTKPQAPESAKEARRYKETPISLPEKRPKAQRAPKEDIEQMAISAPETALQEKPRVIGVFQNAYILVELGDQLIMIDQHAAHERILFEKFQREISSGVAMQTLLMPDVFPATPRETAIVADNREALLSAGYDVEPLGDRAVQVRAVPCILGQNMVKPLFLEMIDSLDRLRDATMARRHEVIIMASCKHAIKAGESLSEDQIEELVSIMADTDAPSVCAHGRPVLKVWTKNEIEKMFKRT